MYINFNGTVSSEDQNLINSILPGLGYFGHSPETFLEVPVRNEIDSIEISIEAPHDEILNISEILLFDENSSPISKKDIFSSAEISSNFLEGGDSNILPAIISGALLHSKRERRPSVIIKFKRSIHISHIKIKNRAGRSGARSRFITVKTYSSTIQVTNFRLLSPEIALERLDRILNFAGFDKPTVLTKQEMAEFKVKLKTSLVEKLEHQGRSITKNDILELLPVFGKAEAITNLDIRLAAIAVVDEWNGKTVVKTSFLKPFATVLSSDFAIMSLKHCIERLIEIRHGRKADVVISRHQIHESRLLGRKEDYLTAIDQIISILEPAGMHVMLGYGTLLGAVRDGQFMEHDDDVDLIVFDGSRSQAEAEEGKARIAELLAASGARTSDRGHWHLHAIVNGMTVDLFPTWQEGDDLHITMQKLALRPVPFKNMFPTSTINLYDRTYPAPAVCAAFLEDRYGPGWSVPDPYYEWPWKIDRIISGLPPYVLKSIDRRKHVTRKHFGRLCRVAWGQRVNKGETSPPMNSLAIIDVAKEVGYDAVELDVRVTADNVAVLAHDDLLHGPEGQINVLKVSADEATQFKLGAFDGKAMFVPRLTEALSRAQGIDVQIDSRINAAQVAILRNTVDEVGFDPARLQFCVYNVAHAQALLRYFPESVLMWKTYRPFTEVDAFFLDEAQALGMDGVMISVPRNYEDYSGFMTQLRARGLRVLMFIHSGDERKLKRMVDQGVDYVTTLAHQMETFKKLAGSV